MNHYLCKNFKKLKLIIFGQITIKKCFLQILNNFESNAQITVNF